MYHENFSGNYSSGSATKRSMPVTITDTGSSNLIQCGYGSFDIKEGLKFHSFRFDGQNKQWYRELHYDEDIDITLEAISKLAMQSGLDIAIKANTARKPLQPYANHTQNIPFQYEVGTGGLPGQFPKPRQNVVVMKVSQSPSGQTISLSGQTFDIKEQIKPLGFRYQGDSKSWAIEVGSESEQQLLVKDIQGICEELGIQLSA